MKKLLSIALFALCFSANAQSSYNVYGTTNGYQNLTPSQTITQNTHGGYDIYNNSSSGLPSLTPSQTISSNIYRYIRYYILYIIIILNFYIFAI